MQFDKNAWKSYSKYRFIICFILTALSAIYLFLHFIVNFPQLDHWVFVIPVFCIPFSIISIGYCGLSYYHERLNRLWIDDNGVYYSRNDWGNVLSPSFSNFTIKEVSHYKEKNRHFKIYGNIEISSPGYNDKVKKVEIGKMFSNMHLLREHLERTI